MISVSDRCSETPKANGLMRRQAHEAVLIVHVVQVRVLHSFSQVNIIECFDTAGSEFHSNTLGQSSVEIIGMFNKVMS